MTRYPRRIVALAIALGFTSSPAAFTPPFALVPRSPRSSYRISRGTFGAGGTTLTGFAVAPCRSNRDGIVEGDGGCAAKTEVEATTSAVERRVRWRSSWSSRWSSVAGRFDTLTSSGLSTSARPSGSRSPGALVAGTGSKKMMIIFFSFLLLKWARSKFLLKNSALNEFQPNWGHVITSKEQEKNLHAWTCKECGATMFVAKGREFRFHNRFTKCFNCGAKGKDNFYDRRDEIEDDGDFQYESPVNYRMSKKEREKLEREMEEAREREAEEAKEAVEAEEEVIAVSADDGGSDTLEVVDAEEVEVKEKEESASDEAGEEGGGTSAAVTIDAAAEDGESGAVVVAAESEGIEVERVEDEAEGGSAKSTDEQVLTASAAVEGAASDEAAKEGVDGGGGGADVDEWQTFVGEKSDHADAEVEEAGAGAVENDAVGDASSSSVSSSSPSDGTHAVAASTTSPVPEVPAAKNSAEESTTTTTSSKTGSSSSLKQSPIAAKEKVGGEDSLDALGMDGF